MPVRMIPGITSLTVRATMMGMAAGLRSMTPFGVMASRRNDASVREGWKQWPVLRSKPGRIGLQLAWAGELAGDKLPNVPARTNPGPLMGRTVFGALAGLAIGTQGKGTKARAIGAMCGAAGGVAGSFMGYGYRTIIAQKTNLPDLPFALIEDVAAWAIAEKALRG